MSALHVFDMDGTLLRGTTSVTRIGEQLGVAEATARLETQFATGQIAEPEFGAALLELWVELTDQIVAEVVEGAPWIEGIEEVCADITARGETSMLITMSPEFFARHLHRRGLDIVHGARYPTLPFNRSGTEAFDPGGLLTPAHKVTHTETERRRLGLPASACVAYGDSTSDGPLFTHLTNTVAVNADPTVEALARRAYRGDDLREAYRHGRDQLETATSAGARRGSRREP